jgi:hypothetical protein
MLLHYQAADQVGWTQVIGQQAVRLVLPFRLIEELGEMNYTALGTGSAARSWKRRLAALRPGVTGSDHDDKLGA